VGSSSTIGVKFKVAASGTRIVVANWTFSVSGSQSLTNASCIIGKRAVYGYCVEFAKAYVSAYSYLVDLSTGSTVGGLGYLVEYNLSYNFWNCHNGTCTSTAFGPSTGGFSGTFVVPFSWNTTMSSTHSYGLYMLILESADVDIETSHATFASPVHGSAVIDMASNGNGAVLNSITIT
jgi:hypothetical protein